MIIENQYPKVSIVTCVYNGEKYITRLLDSILEMEYPNIEHIIVDDGSTDLTKNIVFKYSSLYKNKNNSHLYIKYIKQENKGLGEATLIGLKNVSGKYWTWINCDDNYTGDFCGELVKVFLSNPTIDVVVSNGCWHILDSDKRYTIYCKDKVRNINAIYSSSKRLTGFLAFNQNFHHTLYMVKTDSYLKLTNQKFFCPVRYTQDVELAKQLFPFLNCYFCNKILFSLNIHKGQLYESFRGDDKIERLIHSAAGVSVLYVNDTRKKEVHFVLSIVSPLVLSMWSFFRTKNFNKFKKNYNLFMKAKRYAKLHHIKYKKYLPFKIKIKILLLGFVYLLI